MSMTEAMRSTASPKVPLSSTSTWSSSDFSVPTRASRNIG
jgi:hypothetical protein